MVNALVPRSPGWLLGMPPPTFRYKKSERHGFTKLAVSPLIMVRFSKFEIWLAQLFHPDLLILPSHGPISAYSSHFLAYFKPIWAILDLFREFGPRFGAFKAYLGEFVPRSGSFRAYFLESEPGFGKFRAYYGGLGLVLGHLGPIFAYFRSWVTGFRPLWAHFRILGLDLGHLGPIPFWVRI